MLHVTTALRAEHKERYAPLRIEEKSISALLEHYKVGGLWLFGQKKQLSGTQVV